VNSYFHIFAALLFVAAHAVAVPLHAALGHCDAVFRAGGHAGFLHVHAHAHDDDDCGGHKHHDHAECDGGPELLDASGYGEPHEHFAHVHGAGDYNLSRTRDLAVPLVLLAAVLPLAVDAAPSSAAPAIAWEAPPPHRIALHSVTSLRGPPVC